LQAAGEFFTLKIGFLAIQASAAHVIPARRGTSGRAPHLRQAADENLPAKNRTLARCGW